jgi:NADPH:quinone reductase-like Zn-dependent oxidoreductase
MQQKVASRRRMRGDGFLLITILGYALFVMRVLEVREPFGIDSLMFVERPRPEPRAGEVLIRMRALSLNYRDLLVVDGVNRWRAQEPRVPASDGAGDVVGIGDGVTRVKVGDRVAPIFYPHWIDGGPAPEKMDVALGGAGLDGLFAEYVVAHESSVVRVPESLSFVEAATLPCAAVTAWNGVAEEGRLRPGDTVVVLGTGGVALFAMQFARLSGARVIVTSSSDTKLERARSLGAAEGVNYRTTSDWAARVRELTNGRGADLVVETAGTLNESIAAVRVGGAIAFVGFLTGVTAEINLLALMGASARVQAIDVGSRAMFESMNRAIDAGGVKPVIDRVFDFDDARDAFRHLASRTHFGKVCVTV